MDTDRTRDDTARCGVGDWSDAKLILSGTCDAVEGDGLTLRLESMQPADNAVAELVVDGETIARLVGSEGE